MALAFSDPGLDIMCLKSCRGDDCQHAKGRGPLGFVIYIYILLLLLFSMSGMALLLIPTAGMLIRSGGLGPIIRLRELKNMAWRYCH